MNKRRLRTLVLKYASAGESIRSIAKKFKTNRYQIEKIFAAPGTHEAPKIYTHTKLQSHHKQILEWWYVYQLPATIIHNRLRKTNVSYSSVYRYLQNLEKREAQGNDVVPASEVGFGYVGSFTKKSRKVKVWVFNMMLVESGDKFYTLVTDQTMHTFLDCHIQAFEFFKGVPVNMRIVHMDAKEIAADLYEPFFQQKYADCLQHYTTASLTPGIYRGQKGLSNKSINYFKNAFLKNVQHKDFDLLSDDLAKWMNEERNMQVNEMTKKIPQYEFIQHNKATLIPLPTSRYGEVKLEERKVGAYGHIYFRNNYYSVPSQYMGDIVQLQINREEIKVYNNDILIATHFIREGKGHFETLNEHKPFHKRDKPERYYHDQAKEIACPMDF
jgi:transposase